MLTLALLSTPLLASPVLTDVGQQERGGPVALLVATPCVDPTAWLAWAEAVEGAGLDAWVISLESRGQDPARAAAELAAGARRLAETRGPLRIAAHGYGGVLALLAELPAERLALVGTPLAAQAAPVIVAAPLGPVSQGLPWPEALVGELPAAVCSGELARAYVGWAAELPALTPPGVPVLVMTSDLDVVAPPELVRLPSRAWPDRTWYRVGLQSLALTDPLHADLLAHPAVLHRLAAFLGEDL